VDQVLVAGNAPQLERDGIRGRVDVRVKLRRARVAGKPGWMRVARIQAGSSSIRSPNRERFPAGDGGVASRLGNRDAGANTPKPVPSRPGAARRDMRLWDTKVRRFDQS